MSDFLGKDSLEVPSERTTQPDKLVDDTLSDAWGPPSSAKGSDSLQSPPSDRYQPQDSAQEGQPQPKPPLRPGDRLKGILDRMNKDVPAGPGGDLLKRLQERGDIVEKLRVFTDFLSDVKSVKVGRDDQGKLTCEISRGSARTIPIDKKEGLAEVKNVDVGKDVSFRVNREDGKIKLENIQGIRVNAKILTKDVSVDLKSAYLDKQNDKPVLRVDLAHPDNPAIKFNLSLPLDKLKK